MGPIAYQLPFYDLASLKGISRGNHLSLSRDANFRPKMISRKIRSDPGRLFSDNVAHNFRL